LAAAFGLATALGACVERGDFGRVKHSTWNDAVAATGALATAARGGPVSASPFTDDEEELRGRAWRFLTPAHERAWFDRLVGEAVASRIIPPEMVEADFTVYHRALVSADARSPASSYRRLSEDVMADARLIEPFAAVAARVLSADGVRLRSLAYVHELSPADIVNAEARVAENRCLIAWVTGGMGVRLRAYRFSIEHLVIEAPQTDAIPVERALGILRREKAVLDGLGVPPIAGAACAGRSRRLEAPLEPVAVPVPLVRKG
jgi:hypothetical protein